MALSLVLVRHARPLVDPTTDPAYWTLSDDGMDAARRLGSRLRESAARAPAVVVSTEPKAIATAESLECGPVRTDERLGEVTRPWFDDDASFRAAVHAYLSGEQQPGWEPWDAATGRFDAAIDAVPDGCIVVSHGTVMAAWLGMRLEAVDPVAFWRDLAFPDAWHVDLGTEFIQRIGG